MKIGLIRFGGKVTGISPFEESLSNAGVIEAGMFELLIKEFNADLYILNGINMKTQAILSNHDHPHFFSYMKNIHVVDNLEGLELDAMYVQQGSDNLRLTSTSEGIKAPSSANVFRVLKRFDNIPVIYFQTDFAAPFSYTGEIYNGILSYLYRVSELWSKRNLSILYAGNKCAGGHIRNGNVLYETNFIDMIFGDPDIHSLIDIDKSPINFKVSEKLNGFAFAGKDRIVGSRKGALMYFLEQFKGDYEFKLAGKWKDPSIESITSMLGDRFNYLGRLKEWVDVLKLYNQMGSTLYISAKGYTDSCTVTSRFYDALIAYAIPFVDERSIEVVERAFGPLPSEIIVTPENFPNKIKAADDLGIEWRISIIDSLRSVARKNRKATWYHLKDQLQGKFLEKVDDNREVLPSFQDSCLKKIEISRLYKKKGKEEQQDALDNSYMYFHKNDCSWKTLLENNMCSPISIKMVLGLNGKYPDKSTLEDVPTELLEEKLKHFDGIR